MNVKWVLKKFDELNVHELYSILRLRIEVFIIEQNCIFQDADNKDQHAYHLMGWADGVLCAYARIIPPEYTSGTPYIGRVVTATHIRGSGFGKALMEESLRQTTRLFGNIPIKLGAQFYLKHFYESLGFQQASEVYLDDGIEHIQMVRPAPFS